MGSVITARVVRWAAQECSWQMSGELSVSAMVQGWTYAHRYRHQPIRFRDVLALGRLIEPIENIEGIRKYRVEVGRGITAVEKMKPELIENALTRLVDATPPLDSITEKECVRWFKQYEDIHPFGDGNGRTGSILYNWLRGSLSEPIHAPNLWNDGRRKYPKYPEP